MIPSTRITCLVLGAAVLAAGCSAHNRPAATTIHVDKGDHSTKFVGEGRLFAAPDYVELEISVQAECFATPLAASEAADAAAAKVMALANAAIDPESSKDGVFSRGGFTRPFSRYVGSGQTVCNGTFQKTATIVVKSSRLSRFASAFGQLQRAVLGGPLSKPNTPTREVGITFASLGTPVPRLYHETREQLEQRALASAIANARKKFEATAKAACGATSHRIVSFVERSADGGRPIPYAGTPRGSGSGGLQLEAIWVNKLLDVYFAAGTGSCRAS